MSHTSEQNPECQRQVNVRTSERHRKRLGKEEFENKERIFQNCEEWVVFRHN